MRTYIEFEKPVAELESKVEELRSLSKDDANVSIAEEIGRLEQKARQLLVDTYAKLTPWQKTQVARHTDRPHCLDYVGGLIEGFTTLAGDRYFAEDAAIVGGIGTFKGRGVLVLGHEKGHDTESSHPAQLRHGAPGGIPESRAADGDGRAVRAAGDDAGRHRRRLPGCGCEERGQAEAIARSIDCCLSLGVPMVTVVIGEGGSGGAVAIATANRILMLEHAIYTVASPEAAAAILWRDKAKAIDAATSMRITAQDLMDLGVIDEIIPQPIGGAHRDKSETIQRAGMAIQKAFEAFDGLSPEEIREQRAERFLKMGRII